MTDEALVTAPRIGATRRRAPVRVSLRLLRSVGGRSLHILTGAFLIVMAGVAVRLLHLLFTFDYQDPNHGVTVIAAGVALIGVLFTGSVSVFGLMLKQSVDRRNVQLVHVETSMQTVRLLTIDGKEPACSIQVSAALLALAKLGEVDLAISLAADLWPDKRISSSAAVLLADHGLRARAPTTQRAAAMLLYNNVDRLNYKAKKQYEWPDALDEWNHRLPVEVRILVAATLAEWLKQPASERSTDFPRHVLTDAQLDRSPEVRHVIAMAQLPAHAQVSPAPAE